ncbi:hypothetical protein ACDA63_09250 [Uliginosibacterium sp. sgz301328]|uniref:hypothetical protein n=1 Tax=Uliginosibacterium sp. sgz301328 TaxID=3243764 RepID=UPI00359D5617
MQQTSGRISSVARANGKENALPVIQPVATLIRILGPVLLGFVVLAVLLLVRGRYLQTGSNDLIQHYLLVDEIMQHGHVRPSPLPNIWGMESYPPMSHWMAAVAGWIGGSGIVGMMLITVASIYLSYSAMMRTISSTSSILVFVALFFALQFSLSFVGWEVVQTFFYPQIVANVVYFCMLLVASRLANSEGRATLLLVAGWVTMWIQPVVAVHILALACFLALFDVFESRRGGKALIRSVVVFVVTTLAAAAVVLLNPVFRTMRTIASNDGWLMLGYSNVVLVAVLCGAVGAVNVYRRRSRIDVVLGCAVLAATSLVVLQFLALRLFGDGSMYAVKKHMFIVFTLGVMNVARIVASKLEFERIENLRAWVAPVAAGFMALVPLRDFKEPILPVVQAMKFSDNAVSYVMPSSDVKSGKTVFWDPSASGFVNVLVTAGAIQHAFDNQTNAWVLGQKAVPADAKFVITKRTDELSQNCDKIVLQGRVYEIVDVSCFRGYRPGQKIEMKSGGQTWQYGTSGWYDPEVWGVWGGASSELKLHIVPPLAQKDYELRLEGMPFISPRRPSQNVDVVVNGRKIAQWHFDANSPDKPVAATIPRELIGDGSVVIRFDAPDAISPVDAQVSVDPRKLGLGVRSVQIDVLK